MVAPPRNSLKFVVLRGSQALLNFSYSRRKERKGEYRRSAGAIMAIEKSSDARCLILLRSGCSAIDIAQV